MRYLVTRSTLYIMPPKATTRFAKLALDVDAVADMHQNAVRSEGFDGSAPGTRRCRERTRAEFEELMLMSPGIGDTDTIWSSETSLLMEFANPCFNTPGPKQDVSKMSGQLPTNGQQCKVYSPLCIVQWGIKVAPTVTLLRPCNSPASHEVAAIQACLEETSW